MVGVARVRKVLDAAYDMGILPDMRVRISLLDEYKHVKDRFRSLGYNPIYGERFSANQREADLVMEALSSYDLQYESCAEPLLEKYKNVTAVGCVSNKEAHLFHLDDSNSYCGQRRNCKCIDYKTEMLHKKKRCNNECLYCYWRDDG